MTSSAALRRVLFAGGFAALALIGAATREEGAGRTLDEKLHHLGNDVIRDWPEVAAEPEGVRLDVRFQSAANASEWTVFVEQRSIGAGWRLKANGVELAQLKTGAERVTRHYSVPAGAFATGENVLSFEPDDPADDVVLGKVRLVEQSLREMFDTRPVRVRVRDAHSGSGLPARITLVDAKGDRAALYYGERPRTAVRDGVIYVPEDGASFELPIGTYTSYATRGPEWSLSVRTVTVAADGGVELEHELRREVDTSGFVAADTHLHTLQFSGHGDASADERQVTLAGEGVEFAVATDHNHNTDYAPFQRSLGLSRHFTAVVGNEVTTEVGHFNGFPLRAGDALPDHKLTDYVQIVDAIRAKGAKVVILNHPRWPSREDSPFGKHHLDRVLGRFEPHLELPVDATEMINSTTEQPDPLFLFGDWFALLNRGVRIFAVGSSDSHTVGEPVGQGRTYVPSKSDDPAQIDVDAACEAIKNGRTSIGMGIFATVELDGRWRMGDIASLAERTDRLRFALRVQAPAWVTPRHATLFVNGVERERREVPRAADQPTDSRIEFELDPPAHDAWVVCVVTGDNVAGPYWPVLNPYTLAATNPIFLDREGEGWTSARDIARAWSASAANDDEWRSSFARGDDAVRTHMAALAVDAFGEAATKEQRASRLRELCDASPQGALMKRYLERFD